MIKKAFLTFITFFLIQAPYYSQEIIVKEGDTLSKIAARYKVTVRSIMDSNQIYNGDSLKAGDKISLPINAVKVDDEIIKNRLKIYREKTTPLIDFYNSLGLLQTISGDGSVEEVAGRIELVTI